jgi:DNA (cytosine-5)-methyltransferase 1
MWNAREHPDLIDQTRRLLRQTGLPYVIENVPGAPLRDAVTICGAALGLHANGRDLARHRLFECSFPVMVPPCAHGSRPVLGVYGDHARLRRRHHRGDQRGSQLVQAEGRRWASDLMGIDWMTWKELSQAIPPAYTQHIGHFLMNAVQHARTEAV